MGMPFSNYMGQVSKDGTQGDQPTLRAASELYNVDFTITSTIETEGRTGISPTGFNSLWRIILGHFAEGYEDHYVLLSFSGKAGIESKDIDFKLEEKVEPKIKYNVELDHKIEIEERIEVEEKTEVKSSGKNYAHYDQF